MKEKAARTAVDGYLIRYRNAFHEVAEKCSGTLALALIQGLVMTAAVMKKNQFHGLMYCSITFIALVATVGFFTCFLVIIDVINKQEECGKYLKSFIFLFYICVYIGSILSAVATFNSLKG
ncbi:hypothetical protein [Citrobacter sp. BDA59-3]|uniref:hypothetical protein n=1 Tax=Citrobacter sp. BDA59-3 TaxID=2781952 RepID=UPI001880B3ED|nr:hypothetical protein [Citrobacter sp. BDA59-3]QOV70566.1 hypothetical protein IP582_09325 [Citrobacter sp. BDA59-3]